MSPFTSRRPVTGDSEWKLGVTVAAVADVSPWDTWWPGVGVGVARERLLGGPRLGCCHPAPILKRLPGTGAAVLTPVTLSFPVVNCSDPGLVDNAVRHGQQGPTDAFVYGQSVLFRCKRGFYLLGSSALTCTASGSWDRSLPRCLGECGPWGSGDQRPGRAPACQCFRVQVLNECGLLGRPTASTGCQRLEAPRGGGGGLRGGGGAQAPGGRPLSWALRQPRLRAGLAAPSSH